MTRKELAMGSLTFAAVIVAGFVSVNLVDRHFASAETRSGPPEACVEADGSWKNWLWPNVPMLSPKCKPGG